MPLGICDLCENMSRLAKRQRRVFDIVAHFVLGLFWLKGCPLFRGAGFYAIVIWASGVLVPYPRRYTVAA